MARAALPPTDNLTDGPADSAGRAVAEVREMELGAVFWRWLSGRSPATEVVLLPALSGGLGVRRFRQLDAMSRAEGFARLLAHSFNAADHAGEGVRQIVRLLRSCRCYDLTIADLDEAVMRVLLAAGPPESDSTASSQATHRRFTRAAYRRNTECSHRQTS